MTYQESKQAKREAEQQRRNRRDYMRALVVATRGGNEIAARALQAAFTANNGKAVEVGGREYEVDEKGTYRRTGRPLGH